jgi:hypothetical protein
MTETTPTHTFKPLPTIPSRIPAPRPTSSRHHAQFGINEGDAQLPY